MSRLVLVSLLAACADSAPPAYVPLVTADWTLPPGSEAFWCATRTLTEDVHIGTLRALAAPGTHHTTVTSNEPSGPDSAGYPCWPELSDLWASGTGGEPLALPEGVGLEVKAGRQLRLTLHLFNAHDTELTGTSGLEIIPLDPAEVVHAARVDFHGPTDFEIPPSGAAHAVTHEVALGARTLIAIFPHMHQLGRHFRASVGDTELWNAEFQFEQQEFVALPSVPVTADQRLQTTCTWQNASLAPIRWGNSTTEEMCFTILMSY